MTKQNSLSLGSLFDGIGGFPYAASFYGIKPLWASEVLPTAVSVTRRHFSEMEHVGDITQLDGGKLAPVDIITFGSPCQGLSIAGHRLGLADERSGLFGEAIRIIREMQEATNGEYPKIALWENVPGALSTAGGHDFRAVLEAFTACKVPMPESGKWANAGMVRGRGIDLAWCVYNAQYFGVAQRRRRIYLIADFTGQRAGEILFVPKSLRRYFEAGGTPRQAAASYAENRPGAADDSVTPPAITMRMRQGCVGGGKGALLQHEKTGALSTSNDQYLFSPSSNNCLNGWDTQPCRAYTEDCQAPTLAGADGCGGRNPAGLVCAAFTGGAASSAGSIGYSETVSPTLRTSMAPCLCEPELARTLTARGDSSPCVDRGQNIVAVGQVLCAATGQSGAEILKDKSATLVAGHENPYIVHQKPGEDAKAFGFDLQQITSKENRTSLKTVQPVLCAAGNPHVVEAHPLVSGTLCGSGAGLSRTAGMASETDLCVVQEVIPIHDRATRCSGGDKACGSGNGLGVGKNGDPAPTITAGDRHAVGTGRIQSPVSILYIVRRLTPTECERLQGYPDGWTEYGHDGKLISDTKRYQMLGNSIAVPCAAYIMQGVVDALLSEGG